jgi:hypothetical protein
LSPPPSLAVVLACPAVHCVDYYGDTYNKDTAGDVLAMMRASGEECDFEEGD